MRTGKWFRSALLASLTVSGLGFLSSCTPCVTYTQMCDLIGGAPVGTTTSSGRNVVLEDPGTIAAYHGFSCAESDQRGTEEVLKLEESLEIPRYAGNAAVFLNGWRMNYLSSDHHVGGLGTMISNIRLEDKTLKWQASGVLADKNFDDGYKWCYFYTVVAWNPTNLNLVVDQKDGSCDNRTPSDANFFITDNKGTTTALSSFPSFLFNPDFASGKTVAILPRGFGFKWSSECDTDHHLLQIGVNLDHGEAFVENEMKYKKGFFQDLTPVPVPQPPPADTVNQVDSGFVSWDTYAIFKDNDGRRGYGFGHMASGLGGKDVAVIQPPFSILPHEDTGVFGACLGEASGLQTKDVAVENVPYEYAIPMLTGWDIGCGCDDEHVTEVGTWLDEFHYDKAPNAPAGTLHYKVSSILRDKDGSPGHAYSHKVSILAFKPTASALAPDLIPFSPTGTGPLSFCRLEQNGTLLRVTIKNQGNGNAGASKTTVVFNNQPVTLDTPPVPAGGSVDLLFGVPRNCFSPDCSFRITVDSENQVDELSNEGNNTVGGGCLG
ncbi:hypothetical protein GEOBRER4_n1404 [Citrifermentans bremense]|uniref:CARDB domain-containing protein n=1 Tax=Citrifermentans bremense TaxID=60035 RepID=A0A6S6LZ65_9BACT|nr:CARDB domain-containing protein [Citrifermentans bremense]BCG46598.1 hypothetical protein GEOBRER4_n1404 [Citrifermentans bremense]